jgi:putative addiction module CopG family antidote
MTIMPPIEIQLNEYFDAFVRAHAGHGPYRNATDVIEAGLRLLDEQEQERLAKGRGPDELDTPAKEAFARLEARYRALAEQLARQAPK